LPSGPAGFLDFTDVSAYFFAVSLQGSELVLIHYYGSQVAKITPVGKLRCYLERVFFTGAAYGYGRVWLLMGLGSHRASAIW
jgi:hypothetical protein